jgi:glycosyltransferase involved in cell wall biosynthesis
MQAFMNMLLVVPVYNEQLFIGQVLSQLLNYFRAEHILVIDDGSTDQTADIVKQYNVQLITHPTNKGKGVALKSAFKYALTNEYDWIITIDADMQHNPAHLPQFIDEIEKNKSDLIIGNRINRYEKMPLHRQLSNGFSSVLVSLCAGNQRILDSQSGFRAIYVPKIPLAHLNESGFQLESEILLRMGKAGCRISHVPITTEYGKESSSIHVFYDTVRFLKLIVKSFSW